MKDLSENINWEVTVKTFILFCRKVFLSAFHLERRSFEKIGRKIWNAQPQHSHLGPPQHQPALPFGHVVVTPATSNTVCDGFHQGFRGFLQSLPWICNTQSPEIQSQEPHTAGK
jgi:hypothetical protein